jgi:hypothetical protein
VTTRVVEVAASAGSFGPIAVPAATVVAAIRTAAGRNTT